MDEARIDEVLAQTLADGRLSRSERKAFGALLDEFGGNQRELDVVRGRAFVLAREAMANRSGREVLDWLEGVVRVVAGARCESEPELICEAVFSPGPDCLRRIIGLFTAAIDSADGCVYTITDDRITRAILAAHHRGVRVRLLTDNAKSHDLGSDIDQLESAGVPIAVDHSPAHMHHKFLIVDQRRLATGSFNWTRAATEHNQENLVLTSHPDLVRRFASEFEHLWRLFR